MISRGAVIDAFLSALAEYHIRPSDPSQIQLDGQFHRLHVDGDRPTQRNLSYRIHHDARPAGFFEDHKRGVSDTFSVSNGVDLDPAARAEAAKVWAETQRQREIEREAGYTAAAATAAEIYAAATPADRAHAYVVRKGLTPGQTIRQSSAGDLIIPLFSAFGVIASLQTISADGEKLFMPGGRIAGSFHPIQGNDRRRVLICEGWATGEALNAATGHPVVCAMSAGNLAAVAAKIAAKFPDRELVIMADNDHGTEQRTGKNPGLLAGLSIDGARCLFPGFGADDTGTDWDDWLRSGGSAAEIVDLLESGADHRAQKTPGTEGGDTGGGREDVESTLREDREDTQGEAEHNAIQPYDSRVSRLKAELATASDPADNLPAMYSEINVARRFAQVHEDNLRFVAEWGRWMIWDNQRWRRDRDLAVFDLSTRVCCAVAESARLDQTEFTTDRQRQAAIARYGEKRTIYNITEVAKADRRIAAVPEQWDADPWLLNTPAGVINLRDGSMQAQARRAYQTKITAVSPGGSCPTWERFLAEATGEDVEMQRYLQRIAGYALTGDVTEQSFYFLYGPGGNGKGVFINTLTRLLGDYAQTAAADMFTERKHDSHPTELATLQGARLVCAQETEEGRRWAESRIKMLTGGDKITARFMRQDFFEYMPQFKLLIAGNHKPGLRNVDEAIKRRLHLIPFEVSPKEKDKHLTEKVWNEAPGIMQWAINGCLMWQREGLNPPQRVLAATADYLDQQDVLGAWLDECVVTLPGYGKSRRGDLYRSFKSWAEDAGEYVLPQKRFITAMESRGYIARTLKGVAVYDGIGLKAQNGPEFDTYSNDS